MHAKRRSRDEELDLSFARLFNRSKGVISISFRSV